MRKKQESVGEDALSVLLELLAHEIERRPETVRPLSRSFAARMTSVTLGTKVELDARIDGAVDL